MSTLIPFVLFLSAYDNGTEGGTEGGTTGDGGKGTGTSGGGQGTKTFTQDDLNRILADEKRKTKTQLEKAHSELDALRSKSNLTAQEREELEQRMQSMQSEFMTKEELLKQDKDKKEKQFKQELELRTTEAATWKTRFANASITRAITDAAVKHQAFNPTQIVALIKEQTHLTEVLGEDGKPTGEFAVKAKVTKKKDGKTITLDLDVADAVKELTEQDDFANLFKGTGTGGGGTRNSGGGKLDAIEIARSDPAKYRELRKAGKI